MMTSMDIFRPKANCSPSFACYLHVSLENHRFRTRAINWRLRSPKDYLFEDSSGIRRSIDILKASKRNVLCSDMKNYARLIQAENECTFHVTRVQSCNTSAKL